MAIRLIVGLGNIGAQYEKTRHNVGAWLLQAWANAQAVSLKTEKKFSGQIAKINTHSEYWLLFPTTLMNRSGQAVKQLAQFYKIEPHEILVLHDELDLPAGSIRLKKGGGHGGHNGLRDIIQQLGSKEFKRLRIGISHPGAAHLVTNYVLKAPSMHDRQLIENAIERAVALRDELVDEADNYVMNHLHRTL